MLDEFSTLDKGKTETHPKIASDMSNASALDIKSLKARTGAPFKQISSEDQLKAETIIAFTFRPTVDACLELWFGKSSLTDTEIWNRFGHDVQQATKGAYDHWVQDTDHPRLFLALIILLDQFRRNMFRESAEMYDADAYCLTQVKRAIRQGVIDKLRLTERVFPCLVLTHSENIEDQRLCMEEWRKVEAVLAPTDPLRIFHEVFARHVSVIERFGRFPHRNQLLGRASTADEVAFLSKAEFRFDLPLVKLPNGSFRFQGSIEGRRVKRVSGVNAGLSYDGPDMVLTQAEQDIRLNGHATVRNVKLRKFIIERDMPAIGSAKYLELKAEIDKANRAMKPLWPRIAWVESFICNNKSFCVYLADNWKTVQAHALLADLPITSINEVQRIVDPADFDRDISA
jgi:uncharacterized protein (DUF924 family)